MATDAVKHGAAGKYEIRNGRQSWSCKPALFKKKCVFKSRLKLCRDPHSSILSGRSFHSFGAASNAEGTITVEAKMCNGAVEKQSVGVCMV